MIRSFVRRQGRMNDRQRHALKTLWSKYVIPLGSTPIDFFTIFGRTAPRFVEIGFGMGHALLAAAQQNPEHDYLGIEVHKPGIGALLAALESEGITNVKVIHSDAVVVFKQIPEKSLAGILLFFPDPWPKKRHHKRRLLQPEFVALVYHTLQPRGFLHIATDWEDYAQHCLAVLSAAPGFENQAGPNNFLPRSMIDRPMTKFEKRAKRLGHTIWDLLFSRNNQ